MQDCLAENTLEQALIIDTWLLNSCARALNGGIQDYRIGLWNIWQLLGQREAAPRLVLDSSEIGHLQNVRS